MKQINPNARPFLIALALTILLALLTFFFNGCTVTKENSSFKSDSTQVKKIDSGAVNKTTNTDYRKDDWWKETIVFPVAKDCTINNYYTNPTTIIREGGSKTNIIDNTKYDSGWRQSYDSLKATINHKESKRETEFLSFWQIVGIALGCSFVAGVVLALLSKLKISIR